jgi:trehalose 6-phosphate synthase/phosphatase
MTQTTFGGLFIASNRLPSVVSLEGGKVRLESSTGGLVAALRANSEPHLWVGWPGSVVPAELEEPVVNALAAESCRPVFLTESEERDFYERMCNDALWPLFHYFVDRFRFTAAAWKSYVEINERFATTIAGAAAPGAQVWVHDFHLALLPEALRRLRPDLAIGFFLHIPFPSSEIYRLLPTRSELLRGILGADYVGFHTGDYVRHFRSSCLRVLGIDSKPDTIEHEGRLIGIGVHPIGVDVQSFRETLREPETAIAQADLEERYHGKRLVLGVERLDYTKGIPQKLEAFERFLEADPERAETTTMLQVLVPSRLQSEEYRAQRDEIEGRIAHVNGRFGQPGRTPIEYLHRSISRTELALLYRRADVMMVTPLRDGMNLVAQEFVLCQAAEAELPGRWHGVLLLSELAGAAHVLPGALLVNPWDADEMVERLVEALALDRGERHRRIDLMADRVEQLDAIRWAHGFLRQLARFAHRRKPGAPTALDEGALTRIDRKFGSARKRTLLLDYDGTLRELTEHPALAVPSAEIRDLLVDLASLPDTTVHLVSGRMRKTLASWFGDLPVHLCAEHGYVMREPGGSWQTVLDVDVSWMPRIERVLRRVARDVPGTLVERKASSVAWHYRQAEPEYGMWRARELLDTLDQLLPGIPAELLHGHRVVEVRARGVDKGAYVRRLFPAGKVPGQLVLAAGDDVTDVDLFRELPSGSIAIHVGRARPQVRGPALRDAYVVAAPKELRAVLRSLVTTGVSVRKTPAGITGGDGDVEVPAARRELGPSPRVRGG